MLISLLLLLLMCASSLLPEQGVTDDLRRRMEGEEAKLTPLAAAASEAKTVYEGAKEELRLREEKILAREKELEAVNRKIEEVRVVYRVVMLL